MKSAITIFMFLFVLSNGLLFADDERVIFSVWPSTNSQENPDIHGDIVVWQELISEYGDYDVMAADINKPSQPPFFNTNVPSDQTNPAIFENRIVWQSLIEFEGSADWDIRMANISKPNEPVFYNITGYANNNEQYPAIHGNIVVWEDGISNYYDVYGADVTDPCYPMEFLVTNIDYDQGKPSIYRNTVVFEDFFYGDWDLYATDIWMRNKPKEHTIASYSHDQINPVISGDHIVWMDNFFGDWDIYAADISDLDNPKEIEVAINLWNETNPDIDENIIVWQARMNNNWDIFAYNITTKQTYQITNDSHQQINPAVSGKTIVWQDNRSGDYQIYGTVLSDLEAAYCTQKLAADINKDCKVDEDDYLIMASMWLECNLYPSEACPITETSTLSTKTPAK